MDERISFVNKCFDKLIIDAIPFDNWALFETLCKWFTHCRTDVTFVRELSTEQQQWTSGSPNKSQLPDIAYWPIRVRLVTWWSFRLRSRSPFQGANQNRASKSFPRAVPLSSSPSFFHLVAINPRLKGLCASIRPQ